MTDTPEAHPTKDGYCCACEADIAFIEADKQRSIDRAVAEARKDEVYKFMFLYEVLGNNERKP